MTVLHSATPLPPKEAERAKAALEGEPSYDGHVYVGGFSASVGPDGSNARILAFGFRNSFEQMKMISTVG